MKRFLPQERVQSIRQTCQLLLSQPHTTVQQLSQLLGTLPRAHEGSLSAVELVPTEGNHPVCFSSSRSIQLGGRSGVKRGSNIWMLDKGVFQRILSTLGPCQVDLFATRLNHQLPNYVSWRPNPGAMEMDALQIHWKDMGGYAFPPFALIGRCLQKIQAEQSTVVLIAPIRPNQPWYPMLLQLIVEFPLLLPQSHNLLTDSKGHLHPLITQNRLRLAAWRVSGNNSLQTEFLKRLQSCCFQAGVNIPTRHTSLAGDVGPAGVREGRLIPFIVEFNPS